MALHYADTSAWLKLVHEEIESESMLDHLDAVRARDGRFVTSRLLVTELRRAAVRLDVTTEAVNQALAEIDLVLPTARTYDLAGRLPGLTLRSLDALHLASAIETGADVLVTYDERQRDAAVGAGLSVLSPGRP